MGRLVLLCLAPPQCLQDAWEASVVCVLRDLGLEQVLGSVRNLCLGPSSTTEFGGSSPGPVSCEEGRRKVFPGIYWGLAFEG